MDKKLVIYQLLPRLFSNVTENPRPNGTIEQNGSGKLNDIDSATLAEISSMGVTHVWYTGVIEHAHCTDYSCFGITPDNPAVVKGLAGSPYAIKDYYDIDPDIAVDVARRMDEFETLVKRTHDAGMGVIIDFVPNHVARRYRSDSAPKGVADLGAADDTTKFFDPQNNFYYIVHQQFQPETGVGKGRDAYVEFPAKASGNDCFTAFPGRYDWYETVKLNYGIDPSDGSRHFDPIPDTWQKMIDILLFWASKGVDGFRCDMAHMVPIEFWRRATDTVRAHYPDVKFIAEIYDVNLYRPYIFQGGFDYLYDKVNLYDTLRGIQTANYSAAQITGCWQTVDGIGPHMLNFLENHDEQRFGSRFYAGNPALVTPSLVVSALLSTGPMMIYAGQEFGEQATDAEGYSGADGRTTIFDYWSVPTLRRHRLGLSTDQELRLRDLYARVLRLCNDEKAIQQGAFFDLMYVNYQNPTLDPHRQYVFIRSYRREVLVVAVNFADRAVNLEVNIPQHAFDVLGLKPHRGVATELLTGDRMRTVFAPDEPMKIALPANGAAVLKIRCR